MANYERLPSVQIFCVDKTLASVESIAVEVELVMRRDPTAGELGRGCVLTGTEFLEELRDRRSHLFAALLTYQVFYETDADTPQTSKQPF
ncbi:MAG: hypothetical protein AAF517_10300 [Planctomycetota bacterium]